jgi:hypothetical protein
MTDFPNITLALFTLYNCNSGITIVRANGFLREDTWISRSELKRELEDALNDPSISWKQLLYNERYKVLDAKSEEEARAFVIWTLWDGVNVPGNVVQDKRFRQIPNVSLRIDSDRRQAARDAKEKTFSAGIILPNRWTTGVGISAHDVSEARSKLASVWGDENISSVTEHTLPVPTPLQLALRTAEREFFTGLPLDQNCPSCGSAIQVTGCKYEWRTSCPCGLCNKHTLDIF